MIVPGRLGLSKPNSTVARFACLTSSVSSAPSASLKTAACTSPPPRDIAASSHFCSGTVPSSSRLVRFKRARSSRSCGAGIRFLRHGFPFHQTPTLRGFRTPARCQWSSRRSRPAAPSRRGAVWIPQPWRSSPAGVLALAQQRPLSAAVTEQVAERARTTPARVRSNAQPASR